MKSKQPYIIKDKDRQRIMDVTWAAKGDIFRTRKIGVGLRGLTKESWGVQEEMSEEVCRQQEGIGRREIRL